MQARYGNDVQANLIVGEGGAFEVEYDGELIYSKHQTGAFPRYGEIPLTIDMKVANACFELRVLSS